jgi:hypothetical protein
MPAKQENAETTTDTGVVAEQAVRERAYEISQSEHAGTPEENWLRAEQELHAAADETA